MLRWGRRRRRRRRRGSIVCDNGTFLLPGTAPLRACGAFMLMPSLKAAAECKRWKPHKENNEGEHTQAYPEWARGKQTPSAPSRRSCNIALLVQKKAPVQERWWPWLRCELNQATRGDLPW